MVLVDTSAWVEFLRDTGSPVCERVQQALADEAATADPIRMEVLAGARSELHMIQLRRLLARCMHCSADPVDYEQAAILYRQCRANGETVRKLIDCLIAAIAIRHGIPVLHRDADFDVLRRHTGLEAA
ncbi:MAG: PIN domain nuclease [Gammaproteobacteria bacterium]|nr:PIN domain nuclease [Gammaproteobacteria bacterium]